MVKKCGIDLTPTIGARLEGLTSLLGTLNGSEVQHVCFDFGRADQGASELTHQQGKHLRATIPRRSLKH
jgi:hypothetical protein